MRQRCVAIGVVVLLATLPWTMGQTTQPDKNTVFRWDQKQDVRVWLTEKKSALNQGDGCTLSSSWMNEDNPKEPSGSVWFIASFVAVPEDEGFATLIQDSPSNSGSDVRVAVRYIRDETKKVPTEIRIALAVGGSEDVFSEGSRSEARTIRDSNWKSLSVVKETVVGHKRYTFVLRCENGKTFLDYMKALHPKRSE